MGSQRVGTARESLPGFDVSLPISGGFANPAQPPATSGNPNFPSSVRHIAWRMHAMCVQYSLWPLNGTKPEGRDQLPQAILVFDDPFAITVMDDESDPKRAAICYPRLGRCGPPVGRRVHLARRELKNHIRAAW
jgi:hypothetical protein